MSGLGPCRFLPTTAHGGALRRMLRHARKSPRSTEQGFTLIELCIVMVIVPVVVGALSAGLLAVFSLSSGVSNRLSGSEDNQVAASVFSKDVESATSIYTTTTPVCGPTASYSQLLGLSWNGGVTLVSYALTENPVSSGSSPTFSLYRQYCSDGQTVSPNTTVISSDVATGPTSTYLSVCATSVTACTPINPATSTLAQWTTAATIASNVAALELTVTEGADNYSYTLSAIPELSKSTTGELGTPTNGPTCGFALPNTGTYASRLCFIGFTTQEVDAAEQVNTGVNECAGSAVGDYLSVAVPGGYTMSFCLTVTLGNPHSSSDYLDAWPFPTWGGAFLGNDINGTPFYSGVGCPDSDPTTEVIGGQTQGTPSCIDPAIYQAPGTSGGNTDTVTLSNIIVTDPQGDDATGYAVVTADAETTDPSESLEWTSLLPSASEPFLGSQTPLNFGQVPDTSTSPEGDACNETSQTNSAGQAVDNGAGLTGVGTAQVECVSTWQSSSSYPRTGTVLLDLTPATTNGVTEPVTIQAQMHGTGLEGVAFGLLLA